MFCKTCGANIPEGNGYCPSCGTAVASQTSYSAPNTEDKPNVLMNVLSFFIPLVGIIYYFVKKKEAPIEAKGALKWALISIVLGFVGGIIISIAMVGLTVGMMGGVMSDMEDLAGDLEDYEYDDSFEYDDSDFELEFDDEFAAA